MAGSITLEFSAEQRTVDIPYFARVDSILISSRFMSINLILRKIKAKNWKINFYRQVLIGGFKPWTSYTAIDELDRSTIAVHMF